MNETQLHHINPLNATRASIHLIRNSFIEDKQTFVLAPEDQNEAEIKKWIKPFARGDFVEIQPASHCEILVEREGC
jgi:hypothetical protein